MRHFWAGAIIAPLCGLMCTCNSETLTPEIDETRLREDLIVIKPAVARYMGVDEIDIDPWRPLWVSPRTLEQARMAGLDERRVIDLPNPTRLHGGSFTWYGKVEFALRGDPSSRVFSAACFYDEQKGLWKLDKINVRAPAYVPGGSGGKQFLWLPVEPAQEEVSTHSPGAR